MYGKQANWMRQLLLAGLALCTLVIPARRVLAEFCPAAGTVLSTSNQPEGDSPFAVRVCDVNQDGAPDLLTANDGSDTVSVRINSNSGDGTFLPLVQWPIDTDVNVLSEPTDVVCCDINGDLLLDLITVNHSTDDVSVLLNLGSEQFDTPVKYAVGEAPFDVECLDLDGADGNDLVTNGFTEDAISVLLNNGTGTFATHVTYATGDSPIAMTRCDIDGDTDDDIVTANLSGKSVSVMRNNSDGTFTSMGDVDLCRAPEDCINPFDIACCDLDGINGPDLLTANAVDDSVAVLFNDGSLGLGGLSVYEGIDGAYGITCCDLDGDAHPDAISANLSSGSANPPVPDDLSVLINIGDETGTLGSPSSLPVGQDNTADPSSVVCVNIDGDTDVDLVTTFNGGLTVFENSCTCTSDAECDDGEFCNGVETCIDDFCSAGTPVACDDGVFCNGREVCEFGIGCVSEGSPCPDPIDCDELNSSCGCSEPFLQTAGSRYLEVTPAPGPDAIAFFVSGVDADVTCIFGYVQNDATLGPNPVYKTSSEWQTLNVHAAGLIGGRTYQVETDCDSTNPGTTISESTEATLWEPGDVDGNQIVNVIDFTRIIDRFRGALFSNTPCQSDTDCANVPPNFECDTANGQCIWVTTPNTDISNPQGCLPDGIIDVLDIVRDVDLFRGLPDPCSPACP